jgi:hypothetical protein
MKMIIFQILRLPAYCAIYKIYLYWFEYLIKYIGYSTTTSTMTMDHDYTFFLDEYQTKMHV